MATSLHIFSSPRPPHYVLRRLLPLLFLSSVANGGVYTLDLQSSAYGSTPTGITDPHIVTQNLSGITPTVSFEANGPSGAHAVAAGSIGPGVITLSGAGTGSLYLTETGWAVYGDGHVSITARANETFVLDGVGFSGATQANIAVSYFLPWTRHTTGSGSVGATTSVGFSLGGSTLQILGPIDGNGGGFLPTTGSVPIQQRSSFGTEVNTLPAGQIVTYELNVPVGTPFELQQAIGFNGGTVIDGTGGTAEFAATAAVYWHGISQVTVDGLPVSGYTLRNSEGIDFTGSFAPVPEPEHYAAFAGTALLAFGLWRRTNRKA
jgi:hypothetical protein